MSRRKALEKAWAERKELPVPMNMLGTAAAHWIGFESGFNAAWGALLAEIRPLVADLYTISPISSHPIHAPDYEDHAHNAAVKRLRELVREAEK